MFTSRLAEQPRTPRDLKRKYLKKSDSTSVGKNSNLLYDISFGLQETSPRGLSKYVVERELGGTPY
jgi:hypothetical protein